MRRDGRISAANAAAQTSFIPMLTLGIPANPVMALMIGALIMAFLRNGCQQMGWPNYIQEIIIGAIIVLAVAADRWRSARAV